MQGEYPNLNSRILCDEIKLANAKNSSILRFTCFLTDSLRILPKKGFFKAINWRVSQKGKYIVGLAIIAVVLFLVLLFYPGKATLNLTLLFRKTELDQLIANSPPHKPRASPNIKRINKLKFKTGYASSTR